ncbi:hypothetical protein B566_EDAN009312 [Ephemera danica]|nr:hypothetical protein B566_EDAN009312 [Ephemera danica]
MGPSVLLPIAAILLMTFGHPTVTPSAKEDENETDTPEDIDPRDPVNYDKYADTNETSDGELEYDEEDYFNTASSNSSEESSEKRGYHSDYEYFPGAFDPGQPSDPTFFKLPIYSLNIPLQGDAAATETEAETISPVLKDNKKSSDMRVVFVQRRPNRGNGQRNQRRRKPQQGVRNNATVLTGQNIPPLRVRPGIQRFQVRLNGRKRTKVQFRMQRGQLQVGRRRFVNRRQQQGAARALPDGSVLPASKPLLQPPLPVQAADPNFLDSGLPV